MGRTRAPVHQAQVDAKKERARISQSVIPGYSLQKSLLIPQTIVDQFGGRRANPNQIAIAMKWTPTGGAWRTLTGSSIAYGLTEGGYAATEISITPLGSSIVTPTVENGDTAGLREAILAPTLMRAFIEKYNNAKFPSKDIGINVLASMGLPRERCDDAFDMIEDNLRFVGALHQTKNGYMVLLSTIGSTLVGENGAGGSAIASQAEPPEAQQEQFVPTQQAVPPPQPLNTRVFISHGKNRDIIEHLKKLVGFAKLTPVVSVEITDTSKPVPQKVLAEMRSCFGGIVHMRGEGEYEDADGKKYTKINDNVLIEIGAAMAMYRENFILLAEKGITLPSNLQGLYVCYYEGDKMDGDATMRLLEGLSKFSPMS